MTQKLFELLNRMDQNKYVSTVELMQEFHNSEKTLRVRIREINDIIERVGARIESKRGYGYKLVIVDEEAFMDWKRNSLNKTQNTIPSDSNERISYILSFLLSRTEYLKRKTLADFLCVSEKTISADIKRVEFILKQYDLFLDRKPSYGMLVIGPEFKKRQCIMNHLIMMNTTNFFIGEAGNKTLEMIGTSVIKTSQAYKIHFPELSLQNLIYYLYIMVHRVKHGFSIEEPELNGSDTKEGTKTIAKEIFKELKAVGLISRYTEGEVYYAAVFIRGSRITENSGSNISNHVIPEYIEKLASAMVASVYQSFGIDLRGDLNLKMYLIQHMASLDVRLKYGIALENPHLSEIKQKYFFSFLVAQQAVGVLYNHYQKRMSEDEVGYFALLFEVALKQAVDKIRKVNILLLCATGKIGSQFLKYRLEQEFKDYIESIDMKSIFEIEEIDFKKYHYVFSTVPIDKVLPLPIIMIQDFFDQAEIMNLQKELSQIENQYHIKDFYQRDLFFSDVPGRTREDVIHWLCNEIVKVREIPEGLYDSIIEREQMGNTDFGNMTAIPHPNQILTEKNLVCVGVLKEPILWETNMVQLVVLTAIAHSASEATQRFYDMTSKFLMNEHSVQEVIKNQTYESLVRELLTVVS